MDLPSGTVTFLFTDIEGSTRLWESHPEDMKLASARHDALMRGAIAANNGHVFKTIGDAFCVAFHTAADAAKAASDAQGHLQREAWPEATPIRVRMAITTGAVELRDSDYFGPPLNHVARLMSAGNGSQILLSSTTRDLMPVSSPLRDLGIHRLKDIPRPERIYQLGYPEMPSDLPPLRTLTTSVHNQPQQLTAFVGREQKAAEWSQLIRERSRRLFTITGFGGIGKTRIAMRIGENLLPAFPDGVWWCSLEQAATVDDAVNLLALALGIPLQPSPGVKEQMFRYLRERNALLILDNLEQVSSGPGLLKELLTETREVVCLITSRRTMDLRGETVLELAPMTADESLELFTERASESRPDFTVADDNRQDVMDICRKLEGVPLAIELAAARSSGMTPRQILQRLSERFRLLQSRSQELNERQRALRGAIDWSYALLSEDDKQVFAQLSVFSGGFILEDAEAICDAFDVFESVMALRQQSFTRLVEGSGGGEQRFLMLDSLREYGTEKLAETPDQGESVRRRHADHFLKYARERLAKLRTSSELQALTELQECEGNVFAALEWAAQSGDQLLAGPLFLAAGSIRYRRGFVQSAVEILQQGLETAGPHLGSAPALFARMKLERAGLHYDCREPEECRRLAEEALALNESVGEKRGIAQSENQLGQAAMLRKDYAEAISHYQRAQALFEQVEDRISVAIALNNHGLAERRDHSGTEAELSERRRQAAEHLNEALLLRRTLNDRRGMSETLNNLGVLSFEREDYPAAWRYYREALQYERQLDNRNGIGITLANLGEVAGIQGDATLGAKLLVVSEHAFDEAGSPLAGDVRTMRDEMALKAGWDASEVSRHRKDLQTLTLAECCDWALEGAPDFTAPV